VSEGQRQKSPSSIPSGVNSARDGGVRRSSPPPPPLPPSSLPPSSGPNGDGGDNNTGGSTAFALGQYIILIHSGFGVVTLILLILLERAVFVARAERYAFKHPNANGRRRGHRGSVGLTPWNRPSLPTYANAMGFRGTGDVEDAEIAAPPPPEYGNTRGSTLLLSAVLRSSLRGSWRNRDEQNEPRERPASYRSFSSRLGAGVALPERAVSRFSSSSAMEDATRARRLEETLTTLEGSEQNNTKTNVSPPRILRLVRR